ncbi:MAG: membrane protein insertase YidC [Chthoniobacterales bacterium]|nr:membrane protein insertase YidC [Chthoniobacterales bacterium]
MDRKAWIAVIACVAALGLWQWAYVKYYSPTPEQVAVAKAKAQAEKTAPATPAPSATPVLAQPAQPAAPAEGAAASTVPREEFKISTGLADFVFVSDAGGISQVNLLGHLGENGANVNLNIPQAMPVGALAETPGSVLGGFVREPSSAPGQAVFSRTSPDGLRVRKVFTVDQSDGGQGNYVVNLELEIANPGDSPVSSGGLHIATGGAVPVHYRDMTLYTGFDWYREGKATFTDVNWFNASAIPLVGIQLRAAQSLYEQKSDKIAWAAVKNQYFTTIVSIVDGEPGASVWARRLDLLHAGNPEHKVFGIEGVLGLPGFELAPGASKSWTFQIYAGPKDLGRLAKLGHGEQAVMNFGIFKWVSEILLYSMNALHGVLGNFAAAIIVLTIIIKAILWPLQNKATDSMRRMAALSPKMTDLREKYKDDPTKMNQELMKLYKDYGVNPFGGCLPMLIQIPIFFGFYSMLGTAIELRNSSFLWVHDLSQPDTVGHLLGFPVNILPLLMAATMLWQMQITPKTGDAAQQRMFMFMPVIFILFAYNFASALSLYWTTQNLISIVQLYLTRNKPLPTLEKKSVAQKKALEAGKGKRRKSGA